MITRELRFLFRKDGFYPDITGECSEETLEEAKRWTGTDPFERLYEFGAGPKPDQMSSSTAYLYLVASSFFRCLTELPELEIARDKVSVRLSSAQLDQLLAAVPFGIGSETVDKAWIRLIYRNLLKRFRNEIKAYDGSVELYLTEKNQNLHVPERIFFHLVEAPKDAEFPFAFMATYASRGTDKKVHHYPLKYALTEYNADRRKLLELLSCLNKAADVSPLIAEFMKTGELFHPLQLSADEAYQFLCSAAAIEETGILCRIPNWWKQKAMNASLTIRLGNEAPSMLGFESILSTTPSLTIDGVELSEDDVRRLLQMTEGLAMIKGKWIEINHARLSSLLERMHNGTDTITLLEAMRSSMKEDDADADNGVIISNGQWFSEFLQSLRHPEKLHANSVPSTLHASLRSYQKTGFDWLCYMDSLGFGACLADDMGLGKTLQVLSYLEHIRTQNPNAHVLLIVPASLLGNWQGEQEKFAPDMELQILHGRPKQQLSELAAHPCFLTITTYAMSLRIPELAEQKWDCLILDEAQAIKNPVAKQTRAIKTFQSRMKIAMTGTPIENDLTNLWSLFDFLNKGLLGSSDEFSSYCHQLEGKPEDYARLKALINPFLLRRMKTDKRIIKDLPDKFEIVDYSELSRKQTVLYRKLVSELAEKLETADGISRRGMVLAVITKLKQICNHPDQYLGQQAYSPSESGKFELLKELCETIYEKRERVLVFTQFREITDVLSSYLAEIFHARGAVIHGGVSPKQRSKIVERFQSEEYMPYIVCSLKAAGTGLNLTNANHVIHFDRWWNPAVENQASDRAFRIGQKKDVMVHKIVARGTIEEKIDQMIESKKELASNVIGEGSEKWITELSNEELVSLLKLD